MRKLFLAALCVATALFVVGCGASEVKNPATQDYVAGQGNIKGDVDVDDFYSRDARFEIGASEEGYAVFKDPEKAFEALVENYSDGIALIEKEFDLDPLSKDDFEGYKNLGCQVTSGSEDEQDQARFVTSFLDIYENSFA